MTRTRRTRRGYSLIEVLAVMMLLVVLGAIIAPTVRTLSRDSKVKAGADTLRGRIADARANAIESGRPYRLSISPDGTKLRVSPENAANASYVAGLDGADEPTIIETELPKDVTVVLEQDENAQQVVDENGWVRVATFLPDGTCREDSSVIEVREPGSHPMLVRVRGLTGSATVTSGSIDGAKK